MKPTIQLTINAAIGLGISIIAPSARYMYDVSQSGGNWLIAPIFNPNGDNWPICYAFFPVMELCGVLGVVPLFMILFLAILALILGIQAARKPTGRIKRYALVLAHVSIALFFIIPSSYELFGRYAGP